MDLTIDSYTEPTTGIRTAQRNVRIHRGDTLSAAGTLYITEEYVFACLLDHVLQLLTSHCALPPAAQERAVVG